MADNPEFYRARAVEERANAAAATLDNVRDRCERAARTWEAMADRASRTNTARAEREAQSAERVALATINAPAPLP